MADLNKAIEQIKLKTDRLMDKINPEAPLTPRGVTVNGKYTDNMETFFQPGWTHSFFLGNMAYLYLYTKDKKYLDFLEKSKKIYTDFLFDNDAEIGHDTGFLYSLYAVAMYKITGENVYKQLALKAADEVAKRIRLKAGHIQAFFDLRIRGVNDDVTLMIVDDMMNMNLLMWAYEETGHSFYREVYESHIAVAIKNMIRSDYSVCHAYHFDARTGEPISEMNYCGFSIGTHWARGTAWMIYGLTKALCYTKNKERYLPSLTGVLLKYINSLGDDNIPKYDFTAPADGPDSDWVDGSAASIIASAVYELKKNGYGGYVIDKAAKKSEAAIEELCSKKWISPDSSESIIGYHGDIEGSSWGDYFFTELVMKYELKDKYIDFWI